MQLINCKTQQNLYIFMYLVTFFLCFTDYFFSIAQGTWFCFGFLVFGLFLVWCVFLVFLGFFVKKQIVELFYSFFEQLLVLKGKCIGEEVNFLLATSAVS